VAIRREVTTPSAAGCTIVSKEANSAVSLRGDRFSAMAKRRFQNPRPFREGKWWWLIFWTDESREGRLRRKRKRVKLCSADLPEREARKIGSEKLRPMNQGIDPIGSATRFGEYVDNIFKPTVLPLLANTTRASYKGTLDKYLIPKFGDASLRELNALTLQRYFSELGVSSLSGYIVLKIKEVLSSVLASAVRYDLLTRNPLTSVRVPRSKVINKKKQKPNITPEEFAQLVSSVNEPYATMVYVAAFSGLRVSELLGLKWEDVHDDAITIDERFCRGDWSVTKTSSSAATIGVSPSVIARIRRLKKMEVEINWGGKGAKKRFKLVRSDGPKDLVFQSLRRGAPLSDGNILRRHLRPAAIKLGLDPKKATWRSLRTSCATWMVEAGANLKDVQGQMRHARISTTMDIYAQYVPDSQRRAIERTMTMVETRQAQLQQLQSTRVN